MEVEVATLKSNMTVKNTVKKASMEFYEGTIGNTEVVVVRSGIGKVNAGICVQILIDLFNVTHVINTGIAGSLNADINIGDIVLSTDACYHDVDVTVFGYKKGEILPVSHSPEAPLRSGPVPLPIRTAPSGSSAPPLSFRSNPQAAAPPTAPVQLPLSGEFSVFS